jgi:zona occludens toxin
MPIHAFSGDVGSGKTYGAMEHVIIPAVAKGRFVITNIDGLSIEAIYEYVVENYYEGKIFCIGHIRHCDRNAPSQEDFFPNEEALDKATPVPSPDYPRVSGGDLVVIDEATRYWVVGEKMPKSHQYFFREHRHFANEVGHTCDLVVMDPDVSMLARFLKGKIERTSLTHQPKELGMNKYVVRSFQKTNLRGKPISVSGPHPFRPEIVALYKSYSVKGAKEQMVDGRQSLLRGMVVKGICMAVLFCVSIGFLIWFVKKQMGPGDAPKTAADSASSSAVSRAVPVGAGGVAAGPVTTTPVSQTLQVAGEVVVRGERWKVLSDGKHLRLESPGVFVGAGSLAVGVVDGARVTTWSGPRAAEAPAPVAAPVIGGSK